MLFKFFLHIVFGDSDITALFKNTRTLKFKSHLHNWAFFTAVNHNYDHKHTKQIEIHQSQITNDDLLNPLSKLLFPKMTDGSEKSKRQLAFEPQDSRVYEKRSKSLKFFSMLTQR